MSTVLVWGPSEDEELVHIPNPRRQQQNVGNQEQQQKRHLQVLMSRLDKRNNRQHKWDAKVEEVVDEGVLSKTTDGFYSVNEKFFKILKGFIRIPEAAM